MVLSKAARCSWTLSGSSGQVKKLHWINKCCCWSLSFLLYIFHFCFKGKGKIIGNLFLSSCYSVTKLGPALCDPMTGSMPGFPVLHHLPQFAQTHVHWAIQPFHPLSPPSSLALDFPSLRVFSNESALHIRWPKYWSFSFTIILPMNIQGWFLLELIDLLAVQGTFKSLLQHN